MADLNTGLVTQIIGPVLDIVFSGGKLPPIYSAVEIALEDGTVTVCGWYRFLGEFQLGAGGDQQGRVLYFLSRDDHSLRGTQEDRPFQKP